MACMVPDIPIQSVNKLNKCVHQMIKYIDAGYSVLCAKNDHGEIPKSVMAFPEINGLIIHGTIQSMRTTHPMLAPITVLGENGGTRRLVVISKDLIQHKILESCQVDKTEGDNHNSMTFCTKMNCRDELDAAKDVTATDEELSEALEDKHLHIVEKGVRRCTRQPQKNENWVQLSQSALFEISLLCGPVHILRPTLKDSNLLRRIELQMSHLIVAHDFPETWKEENLKNIWSEFSDSGYKVTMIDNKQAVIAFKDSTIAAAALSVMHPKMRTRNASDFTPTIERWIFSHRNACVPYKPRPQRSALTAHRLVTQALGIPSKKKQM